jgi:hypothetical protein
VFTADAVNNTSVTNVTDFASVPGGGVLKLLSTQTASASASISFTTGIDSTYDSYVFKFINIHPSTDSVNFTFNLSTDSGSNYNVTKTTTLFNTYHDEADTSTSLGYRTDADLAQSTAFQVIGDGPWGNGADESGSGSMQLFNPSSTTYVKHFISDINFYYFGDFTIRSMMAGYGNTTSAVNAVQFKMSSGNIADGIIKMYGVV